jgi:hypothetical protein
MVVPRIKDREYLTVDSDTDSKGKPKRHACTTCSEIYPAREPGIWSERADVRGKWRWMCQTCCAVRGFYVG